MERRDFLTQLGSLMALSAVGVVTEGCHHTKSNGEDFDAKGFLARLDEADRITTKPTGLFGTTEEARKKEALARQTLSTLLLAGSMHDLPPHPQQHPLIQQRLWNAMPVFNDTLFKMTTYLESHAKMDKKALMQKVKEEQKHFEAIREAFLREAKRQGIPSTRLAHLDKLMLHSQWRLHKQNPQVFLQEHIDKTDRIAKREGITPEERRRLGQLSCDVVSACRAPDPIKDRLITAGAVMLGIGGAMVIGGVLASILGGGNGVIWGGLFGWTPGSIISIVGLGLLVGGLVRPPSAPAKEVPLPQE